jgi:hypothetical protein
MVGLSVLWCGEDKMTNSQQKAMGWVGGVASQSRPGTLQDDGPEHAIVWVIRTAVVKVWFVVVCAILLNIRKNWELVGMLQ